MIESDAAAANLMVSGDLDVAWLGGPDVERLTQTPDLLHFTSPGAASHHVIFNNSREPFKSNPDLRKGLLTALDREQIMNAQLGAGNAVLSPGLFGPNTDCSVDLSDEIPSRDPEAAKELLRQAGYTEEDGTWMKDGEELVIELLGSQVNQQSAPELILNQLSEIGVTVNLTSKPTSSYSADFIGGNFDMTIYEAGTLSSAPLTIGQYLTGRPFTEGGSNIPLTQDEKAEELVESAIEASDEERCSIWEEFQRHYIESSYLMPLGIPIGNHFTNGYDMQPRNDRFEIATLQKRAE